MTITSNTRAPVRPIPAATTRTRGKSLFLVARSGQPCGVEVFTRKLFEALAADETVSPDDIVAVGRRWRDLPAAIRRVVGADRVVFGLPLVAWKRALIVPLVLLMTSYVARRRIVVFLHEWSALHWARRLALMPFVALSDAIVVLSPYIRDQIAADRWIARAATKCRLVPHPPTVSPPAHRVMTDAVLRVADASKNFDVVIGHFGSIYKGKASAALLDICVRLRDRGVRAAIVFVGSFIRSLDRYEDEFRVKVTELALDDRVFVTGYIDSEAELFSLFQHIGAFLFLFPEGMTARRSSVIACLQSGRPVVVSAPQSADEFRHHPGLAALIARGDLSFVSRTADADEIAEQILAVARRPDSGVSVDTKAWWSATIAATRAAL